MLPGLSGTEVCRQLRQRSSVPVIMLTAKDSEIDKVVGLEIGADDYVTKPYSSRELLARIKAVLRRLAEPEELLSRRPSRPARSGWTSSATSSPSAGSPTSLPLKEFELLEMLLRNAGRVLTRMQLIDRVWGSDYVGDTKTLDVHVKRLRAKIEPDPANPRHIVTVRGLGYKFEAAEPEPLGPVAGQPPVVGAVSRRGAVVGGRVVPRRGAAGSRSRVAVVGTAVAVAMA